MTDPGHDLRDVPEHDTIGGRSVTPGRVAFVVLVVAMAVMWFYAFVLAPSGNPDRLEDRSWPVAAEARCARTLTAMDSLRPAAEAPTPADRADDVDRATDLVALMVDDLRGIPGGTDDDRWLTSRWFEDWGVYLVDRRNHADRLRSDGDVRPLLTAMPDGVGSVLRRMNGFARVNDMESCLDPGDL